jgi:hypothetical protein
MCDSFLDEYDVEVDQQTQALVSQPEVREKLLFVNGSENLD